MQQFRLFLILTCIVTLTACERNSLELRLVTPLSPIDRDIIEDISKLVDDQSPVHITLTAEALSEEAALDAIATGDADIALITNNLPFRSEIATVMPLYPTVLHIARRAENDAPLNPEDLRGASVFAGEEGSASRYMFERVVERTGLVEGDFEYADNPEDLADVVVVFAPIAPGRVADFSHRLVLAGLGTPDEIGRGGIVDAAVLLNPHFSPFVIPVGTYGDATPGPIVTIAVDKILVARSDLDSSVVYDLIDEILRLRPALAAKRPGLFQRLSEDFDASRSGFVLHAGTQAYLQRSAPTLLERYSGVAEVVITLIVALGSATIAGVRIVRMRRKNRIDKFYTRTIALGRSVTEATAAASRQQVAQEVRDLQDKAFDMLVNEKLAADESFRIFITLSDDVLHRLESGDDKRASEA